jgi:hypothetical protein
VRELRRRRRRQRPFLLQALVATLVAAAAVAVIRRGADSGSKSHVTLSEINNENKLRFS